MEHYKKNPKNYGDKDNTTTTGDEKGHEQGDRWEEGKPCNLVGGSPSPDTVRKRKKLRELAPFSTKIGGVLIGETEDVSAMSSGLTQLMEKLEYRCSELTYETKRHQNNKVEIKKIARDIDMMAQCLSRKLHKYCKTVSSKLRKSSASDKKASPGPVPPQTTNACTKDAASQTDSVLRKQRRREDEEKMLKDAATDEDIIEAAKLNWQEEWYKSTNVRSGNPWNSVGEEDFAILLQANEVSMETGIGRLLRDRFPEVARIERSGTLRVTNTAQFGAEDPVTKSRNIHKVVMSGATEAEILTALRTLKSLLPQGSGELAIPTPNGADEEQFRKLADLVFRCDGPRVLIHRPQRKGANNRTSTLRQTIGETRRDRREANTEVLLVKQGDRSYGDMVKGLKAIAGRNPEMKTLKQVRRTHDGRLLIAFEKGDSAVEEVKRQIKATWQGVEVSSGSKRDSAKCTLHVKGLDDAVGEDEIKEAICGVVPALQKEAVEVGPRRPIYGGNWAATVKVVGRDLEQLKKRNKIRIGFNMCTVEERVEVTKCFRCWQFGHVAKNCNGPDRKSLCSWCGQEGHVAAACKNEPFCVLCEKTGHRGGSGSCPKFKEALMGKRAATQGKTALPPHDS